MVEFLQPFLLGVKAHHADADLHVPPVRLLHPHRLSAETEFGILVSGMEE